MTEIAFVGCAHIHTPGFVRLVKARPDVRVKRVWDREPARAGKRAGELGCAVADSPRQIYDDPSVRAVVVCTQTNEHAAVVADAAAAGKDLFVEKPLGMNAADADAMADAIEQAGVRFTTGYFMRGQPVLREIKSLIDRGAFGQITRARGSNCHAGALAGYFDPKPDDPAEDWRWMADPARAGVGAFGDLGTHALDVLLWWLGDAAAVTAQLGPGTGRYGATDETGEGILRFGSGVIATLAAGWVDVANPLTFLVSGTEGHAAVIHGQLHLQSRHVPGYEKSRVVLAEALGPEVPAGFDAFLDLVSGRGTPELVSPREAASRVAVMSAMYEGAARNAWVETRPAGRTR